MKKKLSIYLSLYLFLVSGCTEENREERLKEAIQGLWAIDMAYENMKVRGAFEDTPTDVYSDRKSWNGFEFYGDTCDYKNGFFDHSDMDNGVALPIGNITTYQIDRDTLKIWNLAESNWDKALIQRLEEDTLILKVVQSAELLKFNRVNRVYDIKEYDQIAIARVFVDEYAFKGKYRDEIYFVHNSGDYIYEKYDMKRLKDTSEILYQYSRIENNATKKLFANFQYINPKDLKERYFSAKSGGNIVYFIFFIKHNEIKKVVRDDDMVSLDQLQWGYFPLIYLRRETNMERVEVEEDYPYSVEFKELEAKVIAETRRRLGWD